MASRPLQFTTKKAPTKQITFGKISLASSASSGPREVGADGPTTSGFSTFSFQKPKDVAEEKTDEPEVDEEMNRIMGFSSFVTTSKTENVESKQRKKSARNFDIKEMTDAIRKAKLQERTGDKGFYFI